MFKALKTKEGAKAKTCLDFDDTGLEFQGFRLALSSFGGFTL